MKTKIIKLVFLFFDLFLISVAFELAWIFRFFNQNLSYRFSASEVYFGVLILVLLTWVILSYALSLMHVPRTAKRVKSSFWNYIFYPQFILISILFLGVVFLNYDEIPRLFLVLFISIQFLFLTISKKIRTKLFQYLRISGLDFVNLGFISNDDDINKMKNWLDSNLDLGFKFKNLDLKNFYTKSNENFLELISILNHGDYLLLNSNYLNKNTIIRIKEKAENKGIHIYKVLSEKRYNSFKNRLIKGLSKIGPFNLISSRKLPIKNSSNTIIKRVFDFLFSFLFIFLIYWWVYLIVFFIIKYQSKGPILFKQKRIGLDGETFMCYKFRTMHIDNTNSKILTKVGDSRIFSFGHFMRKVNIDEFPQFINVLKGEMSVVGPRPHMLSEDKMLADKIEKYRMRRWVKPGITGFAAVKGFRGGTESLELMQQRINLDVRYIEKWSFWLDLTICYKTFLEIIFLKSRGH